MKTDYIYNTTESVILFIASIISIISFVSFSVLHLMNYTARPYNEFLLQPNIMKDHKIITYFCFISLVFLLYFSLKGFWKCRKTKPVFFIIFILITLFLIYINNPIVESFYLNKVISWNVTLWDGFNYIGLATVATFTFLVLHNNNVSD
ncbi:MAG: hypothetical protein GY756_24945 [bacterium]|nr:hypothetical protein [bacterium]